MTVECVEPRRRRCAIIVLDKNIELSGTDRTESPGFNPLVKAGFVQPSQAAAVSVRMGSSYCEGPSRKPVQNNERKCHLVSMKKGSEKV